MFNLIWKDIKNIVYDRKTLAVIVMMPVILMSILGSALQGVFSEDNKDSGVLTAEIAVVKEYNYEEEFIKAKGKLGNMLSEADYEKHNPEKIFFEQFLGSSELIKMFQYTLVDRVEGEKLLADNEVAAIIVLPKNYVYNSYMNLVPFARNTVSIETIKNSKNQFSADMVEMALSGFTQQMNSRVAQNMVLIGQVSSSKLDLKVIGEAFKNTEAVEMANVNIQAKEVSGHDALNSFQYYAVAIMTMFLLYAASIGGKALIEEKNEFTLQRLEVAGIKIRDIAISNFFRIIIIAILQSIIMILFSSIALKVSWGDAVTVGVAMLCSAFAVGGLGVLISVVTLVTDRYFVANIFEFGIINMMALVGGSFIPVDILPKALQKINFIAINGSAIKIYLNGMSLRPLGESLHYITILLGMGVFFILCAYVTMKTKKGGVIA